MTKYNKSDRVIELETMTKNRTSLKSLTSGGVFLRKACFAVLAVIGIFLFSVICSTTGVAQTQISPEDFNRQTQTLSDKISESFKKKDYTTGEKFTFEAIALFNQLSKENQKNYKFIQSSHFYNLACFYSLQKQTKKAVDAFEKAVNEYEWIDYLHAKQDTDLDNIRADKRFIALMEKIREKSDYIFILRQAGKYQHDEKTDLPVFSYEAATSNNLKNVRGFFQLDSIAGQGDELSKIINMMTWIHNNIRHDGGNFALCEFTSIDLYNYGKSTGQGINCRHLAIALNEMYLAMGFKSRWVTCLPQNENDQDCHVINSVYSQTLNKWLWIDPTFNAYVKDENGNFLSIEEVRERLIDDRPLVLNENANWNNQNKQTKEQYLDGYMAKNLYWFQCAANSCFNPESRYRNTGQTYISLCPLGYERSAMDRKEVITHDESYFWEH